MKSYMYSGTFGERVPNIVKLEATESHVSLFDQTEFNLVNWFNLMRLSVLLHLISVSDRRRTVYS